MAKEEKKKKLPEQKYYNVEVEVMIPATLVYYRVLAESAEQAVELTKRQLPSVAPKLKLPAAKRLQAKIYDATTNLMKLILKL